MKTTRRLLAIAGVAVLVLSLSFFLWPARMLHYSFALLHWTGALIPLYERVAQSEKEIERGKASMRAKIGSVPTTITGTVSSTWHIGTSPGEDMV